MKKAVTGCLLAAAIVLVPVIILLSVGLAHRGKMLEQPALTLQELDDLAAKLKVSRQGRRDNNKILTEPLPDTNVPAELPEKPLKELPRRLNRAAVEFQRRAVFMDGLSRRNKLYALFMTSPAGHVAEAIHLAMGGKPEDSAWGLGMFNLRRGNWEEGRAYLSEFLRRCDDPKGQQLASAHLAWLENDPEKAARYMEIASSGDCLECLYRCERLAYETGSKELAEHYQRLLEQAKAREPRR